MVTTISGFPFKRRPINNVTPFTYRDGTTFLEEHEDIKRNINETLIPEINANLESVMTEVEERVRLIANRVGPEAIQRVILTGDYTVTVNPLWPTAHPIEFQVVQDSNGGHKLTFGANISGKLATFNEAPNAETSFTLVPNGTGKWTIHQPNRFESLEFVNILDYGATPNVDNSAVIQHAANVAKAEGRPLYIPAGKWRFDFPLILNCEVKSDTSATLRYYGYGVAVTIGTPDDVMWYHNHELPNLEYYASQKWEQGTVGYQLLNWNSSTARVGHVRDFWTGLRTIGVDRGFVYNTITLTFLRQNKINFELTHNETGWCNENLFLGGRFAHNEQFGRAVKGSTDTHHIYLRRGSSTLGGPNNNVFIAPSLEGNEVDHIRVVFDGARYTHLVGARWETGGALPATVKYMNGAAFNIIDGGYDAWKIEEIFDSTSPGGELRTTEKAGIRLRSIPTGQMVPNAQAHIVKWGDLSALKMNSKYDDATGRFTPRPGEWEIEAQLSYPANATGKREVVIMVNNTRYKILESPGVVDCRTVLNIRFRYKFAPGDTFCIETMQNSGAPLELNGGTGRTTLTASIM